jgi:hypothetical protein
MQIPSFRLFNFQGAASTPGTFYFNSVPINTTEANKAAANAWGSYLKEKDMETISKMFDFAKLAER